MRNVALLFLAVCILLRTFGMTFSSLPYPLVSLANLVMIASAEAHRQDVESPCADHDAASSSSIDSRANFPCQIHCELGGAADALPAVHIASNLVNGSHFQKNIPILLGITPSPGQRPPIA